MLDRVGRRAGDPRGGGQSARRQGRASGSGLIVVDGDRDRVVQGDVTRVGHLVAVVDDVAHGGVGGLLGGLVDRQRPGLLRSDGRLRLVGGETVA